MHDQGRQQQVVEQGEQEGDRDGVPLQLGVETADRREGTGLCLIRRRDLEAAVDGYTDGEWDDTEHPARRLHPL